MDNVDGNDKREGDNLNKKNDDGGKQTNEQPHNEPEAMGVPDEQHDAKAGKERSSSSSSSTEGSDDDNRKMPGLSDYELARLERIRRNRAYLSQLGLEGATTAQPKKKRRRSLTADNNNTTIRSSSRIRKTVNYTEPSVKQLILQQQRGGEKVSSSPPNKKLKQPKKVKKNNDRMERSIFNGFQAVASRQTQVLRQATRSMRAAEKEVAYWTKRAVVWNRQASRRLEMKAAQRAAAQERADYGGTLKQLLQQVDQRMPELLEAAAQYDNVYEVCVRWEMCVVFVCCMVCRTSAKPLASLGCCSCLLV